MPDVMSDEDLDTLAFEYVLGTLEPGERVQASALIELDHGFGRMVRIWERRLGELHLMVEPVVPGPELWARIRARVGDLALSVDVPVMAAVPATAAVEAAADGPKGEPLLTLDALEAELRQAGLQTATVVAFPGQPPSPADGRDDAMPSGVWDEPVSEPPGLDVAPDRERGEATIEAGADAATPLLQPDQVPAEDGHEGATPVPGRYELRAVPLPAAVKPLRDLEEAKPPRDLDEEATPAPRQGEVLPAAVAEETFDARRALRHWRLFGVFMMLLALGFVGLIATWRFGPERLPPQWRPTALFDLTHVPPPKPVEPPRRRLAPPESQFDE